MEMNLKINIENLLIKKFIVKDKQERYLSFLSKVKTRNKFTNELYHFKDFNWKLFRKIATNENEREIINEIIKRKKNISTCYIISANSKFDGKAVSVDEGIKEIIGEEGTILVFGNAEIVYYEGESPDNRYINL